MVGTKVVHREPVRAKGKAAAEQALRGALAKLLGELEALGEDAAAGVELSGSLELRVPEDS